MHNDNQRGFVSTFIFLFGLCLFIAAVGHVWDTTAHAVGGSEALNESSDDDGDDDEQGGDIEGSEDLEIEILLTPTTNAPPGAAGEAELEVENEHGVSTAKLEIETEGLAVGTYTVSVTTKSTGTNIVLGTFDVTFAGSDDDDDDDGEDDGEENDDSDGENDDQGENDDDDSGNAEFGGDSGFPLPDGLNPMDIATISISDSNSVVVLTGDFTDAATTMKGAFSASVAVNGGPVAPNGFGTAVLHQKIKKGSSKTKFNLVCQGGPANTVLTIRINGADVGTVTSDKRGKVKMKALPTGVNPTTLATFELLDPGSNVVFRADF